jgi:hypothetical protein
LLLLKFERITGTLIIAQSVYQWAASWTAGDRFLAGARNFSLLHNVHTESGAHSVSYPLSTGTLSLCINRPGRENYHSPPSSAELKNGEAMPPFHPHTSSWRRTLQRGLLSFENVLSIINGDSVVHEILSLLCNQSC